MKNDQKQEVGHKYMQSKESAGPSIPVFNQHLRRKISNYQSGLNLNLWLLQEGDSLEKVFALDHAYLISGYLEAGAIDFDEILRKAIEQGSANIVRWMIAERKMSVGLARWLHDESFWKYRLMGLKSLTAFPLENVMEDFGQTPLFAAAERGHSGLVKVLLEAGAYTETKVNGAKPLMVAALCGHLEVVKVLINAGANTESTWCAEKCQASHDRGCKGNAIAIARRAGHKEIVAFLLYHTLKKKDKPMNQNPPNLLLHFVWLMIALAMILLMFTVLINVCGVEKVANRIAFFGGLLRNVGFIVLLVVMTQVSINVLLAIFAKGHSELFPLECLLAVAPKR